MLRRVTFLSGMVILAGCAGIEPVGRGVTRAAPPSAIGAPPAASSTQTDAHLPPVVAENVAAPPPTSRQNRRSASDEDEIVIPGQTQRQVLPPNGDPRNRIERMEDIRAWDQCVMGEQDAFDGDPMSPRFDTPEDICRRWLGMAGRDAVPETRMRRVR